MHLGQRDEHHPSLLDCVLGIFLEYLACRGKGDPAPAAIKELGAYFFFQGANLG